MLGVVASFCSSVISASYCDEMLNRVTIQIKPHLDSMTWGSFPNLTLRRALERGVLIYSLWARWIFITNFNITLWNLRIIKPRRKWGRKNSVAFRKEVAALQEANHQHRGLVIKSWGNYIEHLWTTTLQNDTHCCEPVPHFRFPCGRNVRSAVLHTAAR